MDGGKSNKNKRQAAARGEGQSSAKRQNVTKPLDGGESSKRQAVAQLEGQSSAKRYSVTLAVGGGKSDGRRAEAPREGETSAKTQNVTMGMDTLDCPVCSKPLKPPIFQYPKGDFICSSCRRKLPASERTTPKRCYGMERIVNSIFVPCQHGCSTKLTSYEKEEHESWCPFGPFFCPVSSCDFAGTTVQLLDHLTTLHKLPTKTFKYFVPFDLPVQPGSLILCGGYQRTLLLEVASLESLGHSVSLVCAGREASIGAIACSVGFSCFEGHYQVSTLEVGSSSLTDGLPTQNFCIVPKVLGGQTDVMLWITIDDLLFGEDDEPEVEDDDEDNSYEDDDDMTTKWRMVVTEAGVKEVEDDCDKEEDDDDRDKEEDDDDIYKEEEEEDGLVTLVDRTRWWVIITKEKEKEDKEDQADDQNGN